MENKFNPYARKSHGQEYGIYFNLLYWYVESRGEHPDIYEFAVSVKKESISNMLDMGAKRIFLCESETLEAGELTTNKMEICLEYEDSVVFFYRKESLISRLEYAAEDEDESEVRDDFNLYRCKILYKKEETLEKVKSLVVRRSEKKKHSNVHLLCSQDGVLHLQRFDIKLPQKIIDLSLNYGSEASSKLETIVESLNKNKNGLVLFSGDPGTGKSTFIKYLTTKISRKVIYLSSGAVDQITSPDFMSFIMGHRNSILLIEDAEKALRSREKQDNEAVSNILNITDGILGDCLNIAVIATFNIDKENIDSALVRKGRLMMEHHFGALSEEDANRIFASMESERRASGPMTLAEIYNMEDNHHEKKEKRKVGF
jgi:DNA replication protein DnaC